MPEPSRSLPLIAVLGVLASSVTLAASTASTASATAPGDASGTIAFSPGSAWSPAA